MQSGLHVQNPWHFEAANTTSNTCAFLQIKHYKAVNHDKTWKLWVSWGVIAFCSQASYHPITPTHWHLPVKIQSRELRPNWQVSHNLKVKFIAPRFHADNATSVWFMVGLCDVRVVHFVLMKTNTLKISMFQDQGMACQMSGSDIFRRLEGCLGVGGCLIPTVKGLRVMSLAYCPRLEKIKSKIAQHVMCKAI